MKKPQLLFSGALFLFVCFGLWIYFLFIPVVSQKEGVVYYLKPNTSKLILISDLSKQGILSHSFLLSLYVYFKHEATLKTGEYYFKQGSSFASIWEQMTTGTGFFYRSFTIVPGWSFKELRQKLNQVETIQQLLPNLSDQMLMQQLGRPDLAPEGEFFPETYYYTRDVSDLILLKKAFLLMQNKLEAMWAMRASTLPYKNEYEALIAASLIEKEAYLQEERPLIAGVLINRLAKNMLLQFDPTVIYGMGDRYQGQISKKDLRENTLYNTYVHKGLPPTPIAMPSEASLFAALHPKTSDYLYFVAKGEGGAHTFSETLSEHHQAVLKAKIFKMKR